MKTTCKTKGYRACHALSMLLLAACHAANKQPASHAVRSATDASVSADAGTPDAAADPRNTARGLAMLEPTLAADGGEGMPIALSGTADFWEHGPVVTLKLDIQACKPGAMYEARVYAGSDCSERTLAAKAWSAGEGIGAFGCEPNGRFTGYYARRADDEKPWSIGGSASGTDVVGHALTLSDVATGQLMTCGVIKRAPDAPFEETTDTHGPTVQIRGVIAGVCVFDRQVPKVKPNCPDYAAATACGSTYCELNRCIDSCNTYVKCLADARGADVCVAAYNCEQTEECASCQSDVVRCELDLCLDKLSCAEPASPNGPCSKLQQCCAMGDADSASCLDIAKKLERFGDAECQRLIENWTRSGKPCPVD